jgi:mRNA interferase MazF
VIVSSDAVGRLPVKLVVPLTEWNAYAKDAMWMVRIDPDGRNGLEKIVVADTLQLRAIDTARCSRKIGSLSADLMDEIASAIGLVVEAS